VTKPEDIRQASTVDQAIVGLSNKVMECVQRKRAPASECSCLYPQELSRVRSAYGRAIGSTPAGRTRWSHTPGRPTYAISLDGVNRQLQRKCSQGMH